MQDEEKHMKLSKENVYNCIKECYNNPTISSIYINAKNDDFIIKMMTNEILKLLDLETFLYIQFNNLFSHIMIDYYSVEKIEACFIDNVLNVRKIIYYFDE